MKNNHKSYQFLGRNSKKKWEIWPQMPLKSTKNARFVPNFALVFIAMVRNVCNTMRYSVLLLYIISYEVFVEKRDEKMTKLGENERK